MKVIDAKIIGRSSVGFKVLFKVLCDVCGFRGNYTYSWLKGERIPQIREEIEKESCPACSGEIKAYICSCGKTFPSKRQLKEHKYLEHAY